MGRGELRRRGAATDGKHMETPTVSSAGQGRGRSKRAAHSDPGKPEGEA